MRIRRNIIAVLFFVPFLLSLGPGLFAEEGIRSFIGEVNVSIDGSVGISEKILYDFGTYQRHGIFRKIPYLRTNSDNEQYILDVTNISVSDASGVQYRFTASKNDSDWEVKIGDPIKTVSGLNEYNLSYEFRGLVTYFSDHDELFYNITGNSWNVPIHSVRANIYVPDSISDSDIKAKCFTGPIGSTEEKCNVIVSNHTVTISTQEILPQLSGVSAVVSLPKGIIAVLEPVKMVKQEMPAYVIVLLIALTFLWYIGAPIAAVIWWYIHGRDPKSPLGIAHAWFDVPKTKSLRPLTPGETGSLIDETVDLRDITATIVDLARRGFIKIIEKKKNDFYLELLKQPQDTREVIQPFESLLIDGLFKNGNSVRIASGNFVDTVTKVSDSLYENVVKEDYFARNPKTTRTIYYILAVAVLLTGNFILSGILFIVGRSMPRKTMHGVQTANIAKALKNFLISQDKEMAFQAKNQLLFEKMLPYAIAFGVEKIWAERFKDIALENPDWYQGSRPMDTFSSALFVTSLSRSMSDFQSHATPTRSTSGFSSGFSSGGFSGGGGGGGGGGSW